MTRKTLISILITIFFISALIPGCMNNTYSMTINLPTSFTNPKTYFSTSYNYINISFNQTVFPSSIALEDVENIDDIINFFNLSESQQTFLEEHGFLAVNYSSYRLENPIDVYSLLLDNNIPVFITVDTLLHLYHIQFNEILKEIEEKNFYSEIYNLTKSLLEYAKKEYNIFSDSELKEAARRNIGFLSVALSLIDENITPPSFVREEVESELDLIYTHNGFHNSPLFHYNEDYSQYIPRGHYTSSKILKKYFRTMMWYGRISFLLKGGEPYCQSCDYLVSEEDSRIQTLQACLLSIDLYSNNLSDIWSKIYAVTSFFVGISDDLTPYEYLTSIEKVFGLSFNIDELPDKLLLLKGELTKLRSPKIYGGTGEAAIIKLNGNFTIEDLDKVLDKTKGMRLMGQRFIPDSYIFQQLVFPAVDPYIGNTSRHPFTYGDTEGGPTRVFPRGLDVLAVLGSNRAYEILKIEGDTDYNRYNDQLNKLRENFSKLNISDWNRNLYMGWLYTLKSLLDTYNNSYPLFMQNQEWIDKNLQTVLASWVELRHDTILYSKQSYTPIKATSIPPQFIINPGGYIEPTPTFYSRLLSLVNTTLIGLKQLKVIDDIQENRLESLKDLLEHLIVLSEKELSGESLSDSDNRFISRIDEILRDTVIEIEERGLQTILVADVHTDTNSQQVLEEAVGYIDLILVLYPINESYRIAVGPIFSYYEFKQSMDERLTDEKWMDLIDSIGRPNWIKSFIIQ